ncbi:MAG: PmoA family protein [Planctomycetota bacterium]|nr:PmoA family protein [Planctomycetota bacterium]
MSRNVLCRGLVCVCVTLTALASVGNSREEAPPKKNTLRVGGVVTVRGGDRTRVDGRAFVRLDVADSDLTKLRLVDTTEGTESAVPSQVETGEPGRLWWIVAGELKTGELRTYRLERGEVAEGTQVEAVETRSHLELKVGDHSVLRYNTAHVPAPEGMDPRYGRSAHIHPAQTPSGAVVTDEFPPDHAHQSGLFLANTKTEFEGRTPDFWNLAGGTGRVRFKAIDGTTSGPVFGELRVTHEHVDLSGPAETVALRESWTVRVWNAGGPSRGYWICDIATSARCAGQSPLKLNDYHYGGMALRGARSWGIEHGRFMTSEGRDRIGGNHTRPRWCDLFGPVNGKTAGITFMTHPTNFRFPEPLRIHPTMQYMVYTPAHLGDWRITPGDVHRAQYRFVFHDGELPVESAERLWEDFAEPLRGVVSR